MSVEGSNPFARSIFYWGFSTPPPAGNSLATALPSRQPDTRSPSFPLRGLFLSLHFSALRRGLGLHFLKESEGRCLIHELKDLKLRMNDAENEIQGKKVAEVTVGSVTLSIFFSLNRIKLVPETPVAGTEGNGAPPIEFKTYDSFIIPYYEGSLRKTPRRSTLEKAKKFATETATRLNKDGARAEFLSERDRRLFVLAKASAKSLGLEIDELCRKHVELKQRLKSGTLEQAVDFHNDHGQKVKHGVDNTVIYEEYPDSLGKAWRGRIPFARYQALRRSVHRRISRPHQSDPDR